MTPHRPFTSVLIANRGEIAFRIIKEAKHAKLTAVGVYSDADKHALHLAQADAVVHIGQSSAAQSYLNAAAILDAARHAKAEAVHPGYGFLSENPDFAQSVIDAGLVWIGPSPAAIRAMGDKGNAKDIARKANVPVIPGYDGDDQSDAKLLAEAKNIGWPVLIKAAWGGGGRGQRRVDQESDFVEALASAKRESLAAFASDRIILEKALDNVRHIEVQVFGDSSGNVIHLGERDCSVQRRNQKIIEEAPAPGVSEGLRERMGDAAVRLAKAVNYTNAGTVEFLLDRDGRFFFLEMNTRIQVEHPVTESVTGLNLIRMQFDVAMGRPLGIAQDGVRISGHAIEARLCAEDPADGFKPQIGEGLLSDNDSGARVDSFSDGDAYATITPHYDSMVAKIIAAGRDRTAAIDSMRKALNGITFYGIRSNRNLLIDLVADAEFTGGAVDIGWMSRRSPHVERFIDGRLGAIAALMLADRQGKAWRSTGPSRNIIKLRERDVEKTFVVEGGRIGALSLDGSYSRNEWMWAKLLDGTQKAQVTAFLQANLIHVGLDGESRDALFEDITYAPAEPKGTAGANVIRAPMAGRIIKVAAEPGQPVAKNQVLVVLEAMKMEHELKAATDGTVETVTAKPGDQVAIRQALVTLKAP